MNTGQPVLALQGIDKSFGNISVLKGIDCDFYAGEVHCIIGENGAGKSTLIKVISGAHPSDNGTILLDGKQAENYGPRWARTHGIGTIYQELDLLPNLTAAENVFLGSEPRGRFGRIDKVSLRSQAAAMFLKMGVNIDIDREVGELNVAYQQVVAIAKALVLECRLLILDEPTAVFTKAEKDRLFDLVRSMRAAGMAIVFISHHMEEIFEIGDRITVLRDGAVTSSGPISQYDHDSLIRHMVGRDVLRMERQSSNQPTRRVLEVSNLSDRSLLHDISFHIDAGEIVGVAGLIGAGRTEMARLIFGADRKTAGEVTLGGRRLNLRSPRQGLRTRIGMVPEDRKRDGLALSRPAGENLAYSLVCKVARGGIVPWSRVRSLVSDYMGKMSVRPSNPLALTLRLSGGNQQKLLLGRWMMADLELLILDEPTRGVDVGARAEIYRILQGLRREGLAILMISSDLTEILALSDRILVMAKGRINGELLGSTATEEAVLSLALQNRVETLI